ncbi:hypothetical protein VZT92_026147 [Zoarces viviparus]|uniref:Podoplanin n=1 Tax=Zoarces viviparus TaxID=48416 RepID=A0AAW1DYY0_ZOAVI
MNVQLLLLLALAGPFCAFTHASPTGIPEGLDARTNDSEADIVTEVTEVPEAYSTSITPPPKHQEATTKVVVTEGVTTDGVAATEVVTEAAATHAVIVTTEEAVVETGAYAAATAAPGLITTDSPVVETTGPTKAADVPVQPTDAAKAETGDDVVVEGTEEGLSSGQVVGIVIGSLLAMGIVIAVSIAVVRRMGKYSSAKSKKPGKKDVMVSPLRKKSAKQQERTKFWKF